MWEKFLYECNLLPIIAFMRNTFSMDSVFYHSSGVASFNPKNIFCEIRNHPLLFPWVIISICMVEIRKLWTSIYSSLTFNTIFRFFGAFCTKISWQLYANIYRIQNSQRIFQYNENNILVIKSGPNILEQHFRCIIFYSNFHRGERAKRGIEFECE